MKLDLCRFIKPALAILLVPLFAIISGTSAFGQDYTDENPYEIVAWKKGHIIKGELLVQFKPERSLQARTSLHSALGTHKAHDIAEGLELVRFESGDIDVLIDQYSQSPDVEFAEPNILHYSTKTTPSDSHFNSQWGPKKIRCEYAWDSYKGNAAHLCAMIDSGLDKYHSDFSGQVAGGWDYYSGDSDWNDTYGHGTHVAGTVGAKTNNNKGVAGVAWNCRLLIYRAGNYTLPTSAIVSSINAAKNNNALVVSMSFGSNQPSSSIGNALTSANNAGVVCVAAAGNNGSTSAHYPAAQAPVIAVASSTQSDGRSSFSNYGSWVEVAAPGSNILSTYDGNTYGYMDGTSMACPHVAGMAVLLYSKIGGQRTKANADQVRYAIENSCVSKSWVQYGRVDVDAALDLVAPPSPPTLSSVTPTTYQAFQGGTMTLNGTNLASVTQVTAAGQAITGSDIDVVSDAQIKVPVPTAPGTLGPFVVFVTNPAGTSNTRTYSYTETNPPKLTCPTWAHGGESFKWEWGGGIGDIWFLVYSLSNTTFNYKGYPILLNYIPIVSGYGNAAGTGDLTVTMPSGSVGVGFYSQVFFFHEGTPHYFKNATTHTTSVIISD